MTIRTGRFLMSAVALVIAVGGAGTYVAAQNQNTSPDRPAFRGRGMGPGGPGMPGGPGGPLGMLLGRGGERLGLTDAQQSQIKAIADAHKADSQSLMQQLVPARRALLAAQLNGEPDAQIQQLWTAVATVQEQITLAETHIIAQVMQVLTVDQQ